MAHQTLTVRVTGVFLSGGKGEIGTVSRDVSTSSTPRDDDDELVAHVLMELRRGVLCTLNGRPVHACLVSPPLIERQWR